MSNKDWSLDTQMLSRLSGSAAQLKQVVTRGRGARIGQSTVVSQKMHTYEPNRPQDIRVLQDIDAGQAFYRRQIPGQVFHLDIFHQVGLVSHRDVAKSVRQAIETYNLHYAMQRVPFSISNEKGANPHYVDIQTGTGGGRITGDLNRGSKLSLCRAHENHVHIAMMLENKHLGCLFYLVNGVESVIIDTKLELRCNEAIIHTTGGSEQGDMSPYSDPQSDSFLQEKNPKNMTGSLKNQQMLQDITECTEQFDSARALQQFLNQARDGASQNKLVRELEDKGNDSDTLERLSAMGIVHTHRGKVELTEYGKELQNYLAINLTDIEACIRQQIRLVKPDQAVGVSKSTCKKNGTFGTGSKYIQPLEISTNIGELAVAETIHAAAIRVALAQTEFDISSDDIRQTVKRRKSKSDICLLIDASASMAGPRIRAAKFLARHLLLTSTDRICVVIFQDNKATVQVPFTRCFQETERCLSNISPLGSTPLALGLTTSANYLQQTRAVNPLLILITDGVPTLAHNTRDPFHDALTAARKLKEQAINFGCIGLKPHRGYLQQLAEVAGGKAYIIDELEKQALVKLAWLERQHLSK